MVTKFLKTWGFLLGVVILTTGLVAFTQPETVSAAILQRYGVPGERSGYGQGKGTGIPMTQSALTPLSAEEKDALNRAILEEYGALNLYQSVVDQFGGIIPFTQIVRSEQQHVNALIQQATKYGVPVPANPGLASVPTFETLAKACQAGVDAEIADAALYDQLEQSVTHSDILRVFTNLQSASLNNHLPVFQTCQ
jgi:hypothetical protein